MKGREKEEREGGKCLRLVLSPNLKLQGEFSKTTEEPSYQS